MCALFSLNTNMYPWFVCSPTDSSLCLSLFDNSIALYIVMVCPLGSVALALMRPFDFIGLPAASADPTLVVSG